MKIEEIREKSVKELEELGYEAYAKTCDTSNRQQVRELAEYAASLGEIKNVINSAGLSPAMAKPEQLIRVNALGTVYVNEEFSKLMKAGSVIVDVSSNSAYILPSIVVNKKVFALADKDEEYQLYWDESKEEFRLGNFRALIEFLIENSGRRTMIEEIANAK